jgi:hypothetical protein
MSTTPSSLPPPLRVSQMICSLWIPQAIRAAAELGLGDVLAAGPLTGAAVAQRLHTHADATLRLLRALTFLGFFTHDERGFALTDLGRCLETQSPHSRRAWARVMGGEHVWQAWGQLTDCVRTGHKAYARTDGVEVDTFEAMARDPEAVAVFHQAMAEMTSGVGPALAGAIDAAGARTVVDVGGGLGVLLCAVLEAHPALEGAVFDLEHAREGAQALFAARGLAGRARFVAGSFFEAPPPPADLYLLKSVIHDWDDARSLRILGRCREALRGEARLLLVEAPAGLPSGNAVGDWFLAFSDLNMLVNTGGRERSLEEYVALLEQARLRVRSVTETGTFYRVFDAVPA